MMVSPKHFVLGNPMRGPWPDGYKVAVFANGCFWGSEKGIWRLPGGGIYSTAVGYAAGYTPNPTYEEVCSGMTGHTEGVQVVYDPSKISFVDILRWFWEAHDPTQGMGQGNDRGTQYRSGFYWFDDEQRQLLEASKQAYEEALKSKNLGPITTELRAASDYPVCFVRPVSLELFASPWLLNVLCAAVLRRGLSPAIPGQTRGTAILLRAAS